MCDAERVLKVALVAAVLAALATGARAQDEPGLLFKLSADHGLVADVARGDSQPNIADLVDVVPTGRFGPYLQAQGDVTLAWKAPGNIYAQRGTLAFWWRAREPLGANPFPIFRVGYGDHTSWDMAWLRIDWNGHGFDAFVTDAGLARTRVSFTLAKPPAPDEWTHLAFAWDETRGVRLWVNGREAVSKQATAVYDAALDQFGPFQRTVSPMQVQSAYQFRRGGDIDEIRLYDHWLGDPAVAALARNEAAAEAAPPRDLSQPAWRSEWWLRYGWNRPNDPPPYLAAASTRIRKVEFKDAWDLKQRMNGANDGIAETTWPGVYNRSRLPGRDDYFELPDWNVYVDGGKAVTFDLPDEPVDRLEVQGPAAGALTWIAPDGGETKLAARPEGQARTWAAFKSVTGGRLRFDNTRQETPLQEVWAYDVAPRVEPAGDRALSYVVNSRVPASLLPALDSLRHYVVGRLPDEEAVSVVALPKGAEVRAQVQQPPRGLPVVNVLIPADFRDPGPGQPTGHPTFSYGWLGMDAGLDGVAIDLPALKVRPTHGELFPLNIQVKDPSWPARNLIDVSVSVKPGEARTLWLDTRDRILPDGASLWIAIAGAGPDFDAAQLDGMRIRLLFKPRKDALAEHIADRWAQARDNFAFIVEEHTNNRRLARYDRFERDILDVLRIDPDHAQARLLWAESNPEQGWPAFDQPKPPAGVPLWAFRQVEDMRLVHRFIDWWIDHRQSPYGDFGGGISDDVDLMQQWPPMALMGGDPDKTTRSLERLADSIFRNGMITDGLGTIRTDELHSYEEGINGESEDFYLRWGDPKALERLMATARAYERITEVNPAGHRHFTTNYFSGTQVTREGVWQWAKPYNTLILHPGELLVDFNGNPATKRLIIEVADGYLAHGIQGADGRWRFPAEFYWPTDEARGDLAKFIGEVAPLQVFWSAWRWTGDEKYLRPIQAQIAETGTKSLSLLNGDAIDQLGRQGDWGQDIVKAAKAGKATDFQRWAAWDLTGDKRYLEDLYGRQIQTANQRMDMVTEQHWWSDRVELFSDELQRSRLGGMALRRNQTAPGHTVSWRFDAPARGEDVAILMPGATPKRFRVIAFNLSDRAVGATLTGWDVLPGRWRLVSGTDTDGDDKADGPTEARMVELDPGGAGVRLSFAPKLTTILEFELVEPGQPMWERPDLGIGREDIKVSKGVVRVRVHSLGSVDAPAGVVEVEDASGKVIGLAKVPALKAPLDLLPKTVEVKVSVHGAPARVRVRLLGDVRQITPLNDVVELGEGAAQ
jgi:hypothetical protein